MADNSGSMWPRGPRAQWRAMMWSFQGLRAAWRLESSFRTEVFLFAVLAPLGWYFGQSPVERVLLIGSPLLVLAAELLNSAIEALIDRYGPEQHELAGRAKDMGSAAVFVLLVNMGLCWALIVGPQWLGG